MKEIFKILTIENNDFDNYSISNFGRIKNNKTNNILKFDSSSDYYRVNLYRKSNKKPKHFLVHRLVALYFVNGNKSLIVNHKDGNKHNNIYTNLEWVTYSENNSHAYKNNLRSEKGIKNPTNIYNEDIINNICKLLEKDTDVKNISNKIFKSTEKKYVSLINHIKSKRRWTHISKNYNF